jgi:hypothetical protein
MPFVETVRHQVVGGRVLVGPACLDGQGSMLVEVVGAVRHPSADRPFVSLAWRFEETSGEAAWDTWASLAKLLCRNFSAVESYGNQLDFTRAVEKHWPCPAATAGRERIEAWDRPRHDWEKRRNSYVAERGSQGMRYSDALDEFVTKYPPPA